MLRTTQLSAEQSGLDNDVGDATVAADPIVTLSPDAETKRLLKRAAAAKRQRASRANTKANKGAEAISKKRKAEPGRQPAARKAEPGRQPAARKAEPGRQPAVRSKKEKAEPGRQPAARKAEWSEKEKAEPSGRAIKEAEAAASAPQAPATGATNGPGESERGVVSVSLVFIPTGSSSVQINSLEEMEWR